MPWTVAFHADLETELQDLPSEVYDKLLEVLIVLRDIGPQLGRPLVDTLKGSTFANMKELRFAASGVWRFAFAFDPEQKAIILVGGDKEGDKKRRFYKTLIAVADSRYVSHLKGLAKAKGVGTC